MTGPHETATIDALRKAVELDYPNVSAAVREFGRAINLVRENAGLDETKRRVSVFVLAAKMLQESARRVWEGSRDALVSAAEETDTSRRVRTAGHTVSFVEGARGVHIVREEDIPERFWVTRRYISTPLLRNALERGEDLGGAAVLANAGTVHARFSKRKVGNLA